MILTLALGNALRGDDAAGAAVARGLEEFLPGLEVIETIELVPEHAEAVARAEGVLFLDASVGSPPGEVRCGPIFAGPGRAALLHALLPEEILGLSRTLYGRAPPAALVTVAGKDFGVGRGLSPEVEAALPAARRAAADAVRAFQTPLMGQP